MTVPINSWVRRPPDGQWHYVESTIADRAVTRCGRQMLEGPTPALKGLEVSSDMPLSRMIGQPQLCKGGCDKPGIE